MEWDPGAIKVERILGRLALEAVLGREELPLDEAAGCSTFKVLFSSSAKGIDLTVLVFCRFFKVNNVIL